MGNFSEEEKRILDLKNDGNFKEKLADIGNETLDRANRVEKIRKILAEKGIEYTDEDAELFESIINCINGKKTAVSSEELGNVAAGICHGGYSEDEIRNKFFKSDNGYGRKTRILSEVLFDLIDKKIN